MLATFFIEIGYMIYILSRYKTSRLIKLAVGIIGSLALFQLTEYLICVYPNFGGEFWAKAGLASITLLLPLGVHFVYALAGRGWNWVLSAAYGMSAAWLAIFVFTPGALESYGCGGNYAIFSIKADLGGAYFLFYYGWLYVGTILALRFMLKTPTKQTITRQSLGLFILAYMSLLVPTTFINVLKPETFVGIPSIMCGFALIMATIITFLIIPRTSILKKAKP